MVAKTLSEVRDEVLRRLGDTNQTIWSASEIDSYIKRGYDRICYETEILWGFEYLEDTAPYTGSHNADWETAYFEDGWAIYNRFNITDDWEEQYVDGESPTEPANHTSRWEVTNSYITGHISGTTELPEDVLKIERATWDSEKIEALYSREAERYDYNYKTQTGDDVVAWIWDQDGIRNIRRYPIPET